HRRANEKAPAIQAPAGRARGAMTMPAPAPTPPDRPDRRIEQTLKVSAVVLLLIGCVVVLWPFLSALLWAIVLCFTTWPVYARLLRVMGGRRTLAALLMTTT